MINTQSLSFISWSLLVALGDNSWLIVAVASCSNRLHCSVLADPNINSRPLKKWHRRSFKWVINAHQVNQVNEPDMMPIFQLPRMPGCSYLEPQSIIFQKCRQHFLRSITPKYLKQKHILSQKHQLQIYECEIHRVTPPGFTSKRQNVGASHRCCWSSREAPHRGISCTRRAGEWNSV